MPNPHNAARVAPDRDGAAAPAHPRLIAARILARLTAYASEGFRSLHPTVRGRGIRQSWRRKELGRAGLNLERAFLPLLADLIADPRVPSEEIAVAIYGLASQVRVLRGEVPPDDDFDATSLREQRIQGETDAYQLLAAGPKTPGTLRAFLQRARRHRMALEDVIAVGEVHLARLESSVPH